MSRAQHTVRMYQMLIRTKFIYLGTIMQRNVINDAFIRAAHALRRGEDIPEIVEYDEPIAHQTPPEAWAVGALIFQIQLAQNIATLAQLEKEGLTKW